MSAFATASSAPTDSGPAAVTVRYFAAARAASGLDSESLPVASPTTIAAVLAAIVDRHGPELETVLARCSYLLNAAAVHSDTDTIADGDSLDVLPPFAGG